MRSKDCKCDTNGIFDYEFYLTYYEDLKPQRRKMKRRKIRTIQQQSYAYDHFIKFGKKEGRKGCDKCCDGVGNEPPELTAATTSTSTHN